MKFFDYFINRHKKEITKKEDNLSFSISQTTNNMSDGISVDGDTLRKVYPQNIQNGVFIIPKYIKSIGMFAFSNLEDLRIIVMHDEIRFISPNAFHNCKNLEEVRGLENANNMKSVQGFHSCVKLKNITLTPNVQLIGDGAFTDCKSLTSINIPKGCWIISSHAFAGCENLQTAEIPPSVELIETSAFAGCSNLTLTFISDDKKYIQDLIKEQEEIKEQYRSEMGDDFVLDEIEYSNEDAQVGDEEKKALYDDLDIKYREVDIAGKKILWTLGKIIIKPDALAGVKEVIAYNQETIKTIMKSGYKGKITFVDKKANQTISIDYKAIEDYKKELITKKREKFYSQTLIPRGGTVNWLLNCEKNHYKHCGYNGTIVCEIPISFDCKIIVKDYTQPKSDIYSYTKEDEEFFTSVTFYKKELTTNSKNELTEYERAYSIYYPYGARFNEKMLLQIGKALNKLINQARDLPNSPTNQELLTQIQSRQKKLLDLLLNGTNNENAVKEIISDIESPKSKKEIKEAKCSKDWLPYWTAPLFSGHKEVEEYRKKQKEKQNNI